jgi:hypothetical protein
MALAGAIVSSLASPAQAQQNPSPGTGTGLWGEYFDNFDFTGNRPTRLDPTVDFQNFQVTGIGTPTGLPATMTDHNTYVVRWQGLVEGPVGSTGNVTFALRADDGCRLWVDGKLVIDLWKQGGIPARGSPQGTATIPMAVGELHFVRAEMYEEGGGDGCGLDWTHAGAVAAIAVPMINMYPQVATPRFLTAPGAYANSVVVRIVCDTIGSDVVLRYSTGADILTAVDGLPYTGPIVVSANTTVKARAFRASMPLATGFQSQAVYTVTDTTAPAVTRIQSIAAQELLVTFSEPLTAASANTAGNYTLDGGATVSAAAIQPNLVSVKLTTAGLVAGTDYVLTFPNAMPDRAAAPNSMAAGTARALTHRPPNATNLVDWYRFDEAAGLVAADSSGSATGGNAGALVPAAVEPPVWVEGVIGSALYFNGVNNEVDTAAGLEGVLGATCSVSFWSKTDSKGYTSTTDLNGIVGINDGAAMDVKYGYFNGSGQLAASVGDGATVTSAAINDGNWHHVVITRDSTTGVINLYIDGGAPITATSGTGLKTLTFNKIGAIMGGATAALHHVGTLDEVRFYNAVITQTDVYDLYNSPPVVNAGPDQLVPGGTLVATLAGTSITDDGLPAPSALTWTWTKVSGPGTVTFAPAAAGNGASANVTATFGSVGTYVLRLTASDGRLRSSDDVTIDLPQIAVNPSTGLVTAENPAAPNHTTFFDIQFVNPPSSAVTVTVTSNTPAEGWVSAPNLTAPIASAPSITFVVDTAFAINSGSPNIRIVVTGQQDFRDDNDQPYTVTVTTTGPVGYTVTRVVNLTNLDNDTAGVTVTVPGGSLVVNEQGATFATFTIQLNSIPSAPVTFNLAVTPVEVLPMASVTLSQNTVTFPANATALNPVTITVTAIDDTAIELTRVYTILITQNFPSLDFLYAPINPPDVTVTVLDNEAIPTLTKVWGCGLLGMEAFLPLGLAALWRRRRRIA